MRISAAGHTYELDMEKITNVDVMDLEEIMGETMEAWGDRIEKPGGRRAKDTTAMVWLARRQSGEPQLQFADVVFPLGSFDVETETAAGSEATEAPEDPTRGSSGDTGEPSAATA